MPPILGPLRRTHKRTSTEQHSDDLAEWTVLDTPGVIELPATLRDDQPLPSKQRYYRVLVGP
jgi:hypothetical protein